jgi:hypothetical protein
MLFEDLRPSPQGITNSLYLQFLIQLLGLADGPDFQTRYHRTFIPANTKGILTQRFGLYRFPTLVVPADEHSQFGIKRGEML